MNRYEEFRFLTLFTLRRVTVGVEDVGWPDKYHGVPFKKLIDRRVSLVFNNDQFKLLKTVPYVCNEDVPYIRKDD